MIKKILKVATALLAFLILALVLSVVSLRLYYLHTVRQTPGKLSVPVPSGALGSNVNVFSGSGGWFYVCAHNGPAAMTPFGMVRLGPDTACLLLDKNGLNTCGYYYGDNKLLGFSHTRFIGTGMHQGCNLRVLPTVASHAGKLLGLPREKRWVRFSHSQETGLVSRPLFGRRPFNVLPLRRTAKEVERADMKPHPASVSVRKGHPRPTLVRKPSPPSRLWAGANS